ncbi:stage VI sporulation protein D [Pseudalkalibacillus hwajinpoensis]|uniref:stage VI sporulation protein D n=1 Tax=Guptibacillus hwajinpoensis TaxID=208199 RepID=UPI00325B2869
MPDGPYLHFSVEEQVWLKKGQEVEEVLSISLDPDISIEEYEDYVAVKGCLYLSGEYLQREQDEEAEEDNEASAYRSIHEVDVREDGTASIGHRFPVDITIPSSRVRSLEDIYVTVDTFDYTLLEANCLQLKADISISGIQGDQGRAEGEAYNEEQELVSSDETDEASEEADETTWETDVKYVDESIEESSDVIRTPQVDFKTRDERYIANLLDYENAEGTEEPSYDFLTRMARQIEDSNFYNAGQNQEDVDEVEYEESPDDERIEEEEKKRSQREENALYLTSMLTKEEEQFSRMKMCIIQPGDSLTEIAERYRVLPSHLARVNRLEEDEVKEGQILYIPVNR